MGETAAIIVNRVKADGSISGSGVTDAAQNNLSSGAALVLQAVGTIVNGNGGLSAPAAICCCPLAST